MFFEIFRFFLIFPDFSEFSGALRAGFGFSTKDGAEWWSRELRAASGARVPVVREFPENPENNENFKILKISRVWERDKINTPKLLRRSPGKILTHYSRRGGPEAEK